MLLTYFLSMKSIFQLKQYLFVHIFLIVRKKNVRNKFNEIADFMLVFETNESIEYHIVRMYFNFQDQRKID